FPARFLRFALTAGSLDRGIGPTGRGVADLADSRHGGVDVGHASGLPRDLAALRGVVDEPATLARHAGRDLPARHDGWPADWLGAGYVVLRPVAPGAGVAGPVPSGARSARGHCVGAAPAGTGACDPGRIGSGVATGSDVDVRVRARLRLDARSPAS